MNWETLFSTQRTGEQTSAKKRYDPVRNSFQKDYDRIIFSSPFRRLQNKTQVFPLPKAVLVHNRLTHSLEVTSVGRSLGKAVGRAIAAKYRTDELTSEFYNHELAYVVAAACLAHDIGNPPFGHSGEDAIRTFFKQVEGDTRARIHDELSPEQRMDFERFEGNSNAFRVLTHNFNEPDAGMFRLTYTTLAALVKYPCASIEGFNKASGLISTKKSGYFTGELETFARIAETLEIPKTEAYQTVYARHPFVYLTEAADDICYRVIDMEDAHRLRIVTEEQFKELFLPFFDGTTPGVPHINEINKKLVGINDPNQRIQYIRALWIGLMIARITEAFMQNEESLLKGTLQNDLLSCLPDKDKELIKKINDFSVSHIYNYRTVVEIELAGYNIIGGLLKEFIGAVITPSAPRSGKLLKLVSDQFQVSTEAGLYNNIQSIVDFISGMTDLFAIDLYRKITGITIPEIR